MASRPPGAVAALSFASPVANGRRLPLRSTVYDALAGAIRSGVLAPSQLLPPEAELGAAYGVSRTVMREALLLLEEDGLIRTQRGVGRFIVDVIPSFGIEQLRPIEEILGHRSTPAVVRRLQATPEEFTDFTARGLAAPEAPGAIFWESLVTHSGENVALLQEWVARPSRDDEDPNLARLLADRETAPRSMLGVLADELPESLGPATCEISVSAAGARRAQLLGVKDASPVVLLTQVVSYRGATPIFVAKYVVRAERAHFTVIQS